MSGLLFGASTSSFMMEGSRQMGGRAGSQLSMAAALRPRTPGGLATFGSSAAAAMMGGGSTRGLGTAGSGALMQGTPGSAAAAAGAGEGAAAVGSGSMLRTSSRMPGLPPGTPGSGHPAAAGEGPGSKGGPGSEHARWVACQSVGWVGGGAAVS